MTSAAPCDWLGPVIYDMNYDNHDVSLLLSPPPPLAAAAAATATTAASPAARYNKLLSLITALCSAMITPPQPVRVLFKGEYGFVILLAAKWNWQYFMSWHLICKSGRGAAFAFYDTLSRSLIYPSSLLLDVFLFPFFFFFFFNTQSGGDICGSGWGWNESRGKKERRQRKKKRRWMLLNAGQSLRGFLFIFFICLPFI